MTGGGVESLGGGMIDDRHLYRRLGESVRAAREKFSGGAGRLTQAELAALVGLERTSITNIELGNQKIPLHVLYRLCEVLRVPLSEFLPSVELVQVQDDAIPVEELDLAGEKVRATPMVAKALRSLMNQTPEFSHES